MKSTLLAVALVLAILFGLKAFTRAVARPLERVPVESTQDEGTVYLMPLAMKLLNGGPVEEVAAQMMSQAEPAADLRTQEPPSRLRPPQSKPGYLQAALAHLKAMRAEHTLQLKGVITGPKPLILVNHTTIALGEEARVSLAGRTVTVCCLKVTAQSAKVLVNGKPATLCINSKSSG